MAIFDLLFPKKCVQCKKFGSYLCTNCFSTITFADTMVCTICQRLAMGGLTHPVCKTKYSIDGVFPSIVYKGVVKKLVYVFKYPPYLTDLQIQLVTLLYEGLIQKESFAELLQKSSVLVPIPLHSSKFRKRGYNQSYLLAQSLGELLHISVVDCLKRVKSTKTQTSLSKDERKENIAGAFVSNDVAINLAKNVTQAFLIDDVVTSGATLREAAKVLKKAGFKKVWGVTLAHGE